MQIRSQIRIWKDCLIYDRTKCILTNVALRCSFAFALAVSNKINILFHFVFMLFWMDHRITNVCVFVFAYETVIGQHLNFHSRITYSRGRTFTRPTAMINDVLNWNIRSCQKINIMLEQCCKCVYIYNTLSAHQHMSYCILNYN